ncbi:hypothetical protein BU23DRAFT_557657 [Bimuria novae-zelandiae CBS 107.79]|uniref:LPXTG-domain-containing protein n=1 Tax=Bimuria novae-zelandiae CBS 107.79 TaxID=1447943 RepID=A0A6A5UZV5_9PLEO|nr:hypothetical protein BU23DRAFT_557657 [Bimuria novae-zelandiae CBS 107.79]
MSNEDATATAPTTSMITEPASIREYNRGPITKYYEPPSSCAATMSFDGNMYYGWGDAGILDTACYPMGTLKKEEIEPASTWDLYYYSPAVCPGGWDTITKFTSGVGGVDTLTSIALGPGTSAALCCPSDYVYHTFGHVCTSMITQGQSLNYVIPSTDIGGTLHIGNVTTSIYPSASHAFANGVIVMWQSTDVPLLRAATINPNPSTTAPSGPPTALPSASNPTPTAPTNTSSPAPTASAQGLTTAAKIGIGVSIPLALLLGLAFGWFLFRRRRPPPAYVESSGNRLEKYAHVVPVHEAYSEPAEIGGNDNRGGKGSVRMEQEHQRHELQ